VGTLWRSCAKVRQPIELSFVVVSGVDSSIGVLDGVHVPQGEGEVLRVLGVSLTIALNGVLEFISLREMYSTRA